MTSAMIGTQSLSFMKEGRVKPPETLTSGGGSNKGEVAGVRGAEIDTWMPSVKEAVDRFGGSAVWKSQLKQLFNNVKHHSIEELELVNVQEQSAQLGLDLIAKERETLEVLNKLEMTKRIINCLKLQLQEESSEANIFPETLPGNVKQSPGSILFELKQAKMNLNQTTSYLTGIRAMIESFNIKVDEEKSLLQINREKLSIKQSVLSSMEDDLKYLSLKLRLCKETEAAKSEVLRLSSEIEQMKATIKAAELAQGKANNSEIVLSIEEYAMLTRKVQEAGESSSKEIGVAMVEVERAEQSKLILLAEIEEAVEDVKTTRKVLEEALDRFEAASRRKCVVEEALRRCESKHYSRVLDQRLNLLTGLPRIGMKHKLSIGEILSRKLMGPDDYEYDVGIPDGTTDHDKAATVSLGQIINRRNRILSSQNHGGSARKKIRNMLNKKDLCSLVILD